jgi:hypothetical protein
VDEYLNEEHGERRLEETKRLARVLKVAGMVTSQLRRWKLKDTSLSWVVGTSGGMTTSRTVCRHHSAGRVERPGQVRYVSKRACVRCRTSFQVLRRGSTPNCSMARRRTSSRETRPVGKCALSSRDAPLRAAGPICR